MGVGQAGRPDAASCWLPLSTACRKLGTFFLESTFIDQNIPKRQTAGPKLGTDAKHDHLSVNATTWNKV
jgi:hypothetical protein